MRRTAERRFNIWLGGAPTVMNTTKTKETVVDFRRTRKTTPLTLHINGEEVEKASDVLGTPHHKGPDMDPKHLKKAQQRLFLLSKVKKAKLPPQLQAQFYRSPIESILVWYSAALQRPGPDSQDRTENCETQDPKRGHNLS